ADNCAFRRDFLLGERFEPDRLPSTPETVLGTRAAARDLTMTVNDAMRATHDYPRTSGLRGLGRMLRFFWQRAYSNGYCMTRGRCLVPGLRAGWIRWLGPMAPPILVAGKIVIDLDQIVRNSGFLALTWRDWVAFSPIYVAYYAGHLVGSYAALLGRQVPRS